MPVRLISSFQAGQGGWQLGTIAVGNLDKDPALEIVVPYRNADGSWFLDAFKLNGTRLPGFPYASRGEEMNVSPTLVDLDLDGRPEILFTRANGVIALKSNGSVLWSNRVDASNYVPNGGYQVVTNGFWWSEGPVFRSRLPARAVFSSQVSPPIVADVNGNGTRKVVTAWKIDPDPAGGAQDFNPFIKPVWGYVDWGMTAETWSGGVVFLDAMSGRKNFVYHLHQLVESGLAVGRADGDAPLETYVLNDSDSVVCFDKTRPYGLWGKGMLHKQFGKNQRLMTGSYLLGIDLHVADLDGDGLDEVLVAGTQQSRFWEPNETILDDDGAVLWRQWKEMITITNNNGWMNSASMFAVNPDHDNRADVFSFNHGYEIAFRYWNGSELIDHPGWPKNFYPNVPTPPVVGDVDGDGAEDIVIGTYNPAANPSSGKLFVFGLDGTEKASITVPGGLKHIPSLADADGDGGLDVIYRSLSGQVYVQNFGATKANLVSWATHRGNQARDGNRGVSLFASGTPLIKRRTSGYHRTSFTWRAPFPANAFRIYRAETGEGPFNQVATVSGSSTSYTDSGLKSGWLYFYELEAAYETNAVRSAPFTVFSFINSNLLANAGFEENENSHWDKWFTGDIEMTNMVRRTNGFEGAGCMKIILQNKGNNSSISQFNQYGVPDSSILVTPGTFYSFGGWFKSGGISQPSEHWLEWSSTKTAYNTKDRPALPWPDYFTPHFVVGTNATDWIYANRVFKLPAGFPNIELRHRYTIAAPGSGAILMDNLFFRPLPAPGGTDWTTLVPMGATWRFFTGAAPANWYQPDFGDVTWPVGAAKFGAGGGPNSVVTPLPTGKPAYYFRRQFVLGPGDLEELLLSARCTDTYGGVVYPPRIFLNGTEVITTGIEVVSAQGNNIHYFDLHPFIPLLVPGTNTIAVQLRNVFSSWDDVAFDMGLKGITSPTRSTGIALTRPAADRISLEAQTPEGTVWKVCCADSLSASSWRVLEVFTNTTGTPKRIIDHMPNSGPCRFYQLLPY